jgi:Nif-specific regulatory protein
MQTFCNAYLESCAALGADQDCAPGCGTREELCRVLKELSLLVEISQTLESSLELRDVVRPVLQRLAEGMGMKRGAIAIVNQDTRKISIEEAVGLNSEELQNHYLLAGNALIDKVIQTGQPLIVTDLASDELFQQGLPPSTIEAARAGKQVSLICVPIKLGDEVVGTLSVEREAEGTQHLAADRRLLSLIAAMVAQATHLRQTAQHRVEVLERENARLQEQIENHFKPPRMVGNSSAMRSVYRHISQVAASRTTVLIRGESGVGKELVAAAIHEQSDRSKKAFVKFNCAALPESIIESELFGHEKGAFTGALTMRRGRFEVAGGGTIFLDEIGDITPATQAKLLRVLQEREIERVGSHTPIQCDVRVIAATSRNLEAMMEAGQFRSDLYYRLNVFPIYVPALREHRTDILQLANHFIEKFSRSNGKSVRRVSTAAIDMLMAYHWPGNVRELENCIERAELLCEGDAIEAHHLPPTLQMAGPAGNEKRGTLESALGALEYELIISELKRCRGNMAQAARILGLTERIMGLRVKRFNIDTKRFRPAVQPGVEAS